MQDRFNTAAGWVLFSGIVALGLSSVSAKYFTADKPHRPEQMGYPIEGVVEEGERYKIENVEVDSEIGRGTRIVVTAPRNA